MAFEVFGSTVRLEFAPGTVLAGATVECSLDMSVREFTGLQRAIKAIEETQDAENVEETYRMFGNLSLRSWDLEAHGEPIPATGDGLVQLPFSAANAIFAAWSDAVAGKSPNSSSASDSGGDSQAQ